MSRCELVYLQLPSLVNFMIGHICCTFRQKGNVLKIKNHKHREVQVVILLLEIQV